MFLYRKEEVINSLNISFSYDYFIYIYIYIYTWEQSQDIETVVTLGQKLYDYL